MAKKKTKKPTQAEVLAKLKEISEGMRRLNPEAFDSARAVVRRRMANPAVRAALARAAQS